MRKYLLLLLIPFALSLNSCGSFATFSNSSPNSNTWVEQQMLPSQIKRNGDVFFEEELYDKSTFSVFSDDIIDIDQYVYYRRLMQDFGWTSNGDKWDATVYNRKPNWGSLYVNLKKRVAIYIYPEGTFAAFKVRVYKKTTE